MKPILFSTPMVQAILEGRKTMTRRVVKGLPSNVHNYHQEEIGKLEFHYGIYGPGFMGDCEISIKIPYQPDDILWVRETWRIGAWDYDRSAIAVDYMCGDYSRKEWLPVSDSEQMDKYIIQSRADAKAAGLEFDDYGEYQWQPGESPCRWRPSMFMPREAARIFLRVKEVRCERLQEITDQDCEAEGVRPSVDGIGKDWQVDENGWHKTFRQLWDSLNAKPKPQYAKVDGKRTIVSYISYPWEDIQETRTHRGKPWHVCGNPFVWVYSFKRED